MSIPAALGMWSASTIVKQLAKKFPKVAPYINKAQTAGFLAPSILRALFGKEARFETPEAEIDERRSKTKRNTVLGALGLVGGLGAASLVGKGISAAAQAGAQAGTILPPGGGSPPPGPGAPPSKGGLLTPIPGGPIPTPGQPQQPPLIGSQPGVQPGGIKLTPNQQASQVRNEKYGGIANALPTKTETQFPQLPNFVKRMREAGKSPEEIYELAKQSPSLGPLVQKMEAETGQSYIERIKQSGQQQKVGAMAQFTATKPEKGQVVMTPDGQVGTIHDTKQGHALLDTEGRKQQIKLDGVEPIPDDWKNLQVDLSQVPEEEKSAQLDFIAPTNDRSQLLIKFWSGRKPVIYSYKRKDGQPFDEETLHNIANEVDAPITNGMAFAGAWSQTGKSRGGAFHKRVKEMAQAEEDPDDPNKPYVFTRIPMTFQHGFIKANDKQLLEVERRWNEIYKAKKRKK